MLSQLSYAPGFSRLSAGEGYYSISGLCLSSVFQKAGEGINEDGRKRADEDGLRPNEDAALMKTA